jgi:hypothetical protein
LTLVVSGRFDVRWMTPSMLIAVSALSCCEKPKLPVVVGAFFKSLAMIPTFGGAVETKVIGSRPPNGSDTRGS